MGLQNKWNICCYLQQKTSSTSRVGLDDLLDGRSMEREEREWSMNGEYGRGGAGYGITTEVVETSWDRLEDSNDNFKLDVSREF